MSLLRILLSACLIPVLSFAQTDSLNYSTQQKTSVASATLKTIRGENQFITGTEIMLQGISNLSEILILADRLNRSTINGDRWYLQNSATSSYTNQDVIILINGKRIFLEQWNAVNFNLLGIPINQIAYVQIINAPTFLGGQLITSGAINIVLRNDFKGLTYANHIQYGNGIGDPGIGKFIPGYNSPNSHKIGMNWSHMLGYYGKKGYLSGTYFFEDFFARDTAIEARFKQYGGKVKSYNQGATVNAAYQHKKLLTEYNFSSIISRDLEFSGWDNTELPYHKNYYNYGIYATYKINNTKYIRTHFSGSYINNNMVDTTLFPSYQFFQNKFLLEYGKQVMFKNRVAWVKYGLNIQNQLYNPKPPINNLTLNKLNITTYNPFVLWQIKPNKKTTQEIGLGFDWNQDFILPFIHFKQTKTNNAVSSNSWLITFKQFTHTQPLQQTGFTNQSLMSNQVWVKPTTQISSEYYKYLSFGNNFRFCANTGVKYLSNQWFIYNNVQLQLQPFGLNTQLMAGSQWIGFIGLNIHYNVKKNVWFSTDFYTQRVGSNQHQAKQSLNQLPNNRFLAALYYQLPANFSVAAKVQWTSKSTWIYYQYGTWQQTNLNQIFTTDITVTKLLLFNTMQASFTLRNLFNQYEKYHPMGADFNLRMMVSFRFCIDDILGRAKR